MKPIKPALLLSIGLLCAASASAQTLANYQSVVAGQNPQYNFHFDNSSLVDSVGGTATFTQNGSTSFGSDYFANPNDAASFSALTAGLTLATPNIISGAGATTSSGSVSMLFNLANATGTQYLFSDSENTANNAGATGAAHSAFALAFSAGTFELKAGNKTIIDPVNLPAPVANTWYYFAATWSFNGTTSDQINYYIGQAGGATLNSGNNITAGFAEGSTSTLGDGATFVLGNRRALNNSPSGEFDELATFNTQLTGAQIISQYDALQLTAVPEPAAAGVACLGLAVLLLRRGSRKARR
jgi:hypothetical protein